MVVSGLHLVKMLDAAVETSAASMVDQEIGDLDYSSESDSSKVETLTQADADDAPVVRFVNQVIIQAINRGASDIHFEPTKKTYWYACARTVSWTNSTNHRFRWRHAWPRA